ncbi:MAG: phosphodiesterase [Clostridia bacterium]|nr:phosphodiesterase [Clostridia bacterium]
MIGIISDTHGDFRVWQAIYERYLQDIQLILHAGDVLYHGPRNPLTAGYAPGELARHLQELPVPLLIAQGNCDSQVDAMVTELPLGSQYIVTIINQVKVLLHHGHHWKREQVENLCRRWSVDLCIQGHTHVPSLTKDGVTVYLNPGSPSLPKGEGRKGTIALWEDNRIQLVEWETGKVIEELYLK